MFEQMEWEEVYELFKAGCRHFPKLLTEPVSAETVFVNYNQDGYIYGYDWLVEEGATQRKQMIEKDSIQFQNFTKHTNKGTVQTAEMLIEALDDEELAAVWIAATAKELCECEIGSDMRYYAKMFYMAACGFLKNRYFLWHHAMKKLVPEILIPWFVLYNVACKDAEIVMGLIQMNIIMIKSTYKILRYSSLQEGEFPEFSCRI